MISSIINREILTFDKKTRILFSRVEDSRVIKYFRLYFGIEKEINLESTIYGNNEPDILICNNRILDLEKSINISKFFHIPMIILDLETKPDMISNKIDNIFDFSPVIQVAISDEVYYSWNKIQDFVIPLSESFVDQWRNLMYSMCKEKFLIGDSIIKYGKNTEK
jgi:hypothetical protein